MPYADATPPDTLEDVLARVSAQLSPVEVWLFGSRARGDARPDSDWDLLAVVDDGTPDEVVDPLFAWETTRTSDVPVTLLVTRRSELAALWGRPNTIGWVIANERHQAAWRVTGSSQATFGWRTKQSRARPSCSKGTTATRSTSRNRRSSR